MGDENVGIQFEIQYKPGCEIGAANILLHHPKADKKLRVVTTI